jgi:hypothetical protein
MGKVSSAPGHELETEIVYKASDEILAYGNVSLLLGFPDHSSLCFSILANGSISVVTVARRNG